MGDPDFVSSTVSTCILLVSYINVDTDSSFLIGAITTYLKEEFSVSSNSYKDVSLFMYDSLKNPKWVTSIDYSNGIDLGFSWIISEKIIYTSTTSSLNYYWIFKLNQTDGKYIISKCINSLPYSNYILFEFKISLVSSSYVYVNKNISNNKKMWIKLEYCNWCFQSIKYKCKLKPKLFILLSICCVDSAT